MLEKITLRVLYNTITEAFPEYGHSEDAFVDGVRTQLKRDPIRTRSITRELNASGLGLELYKSYPLSDFLWGSSRYMIALGIEDKEAWKFLRKLDDDALFQEKTGSTI
ncbi:MAG TPA: hypothetical protein VJI12_01450 [archaeon]|nr:hypothetical protein [archaeon]